MENPAPTAKNQVEKESPVNPVLTEEAPQIELDLKNPLKPTVEDGQNLINPLKKIQDPENQELVKDSLFEADKLKLPEGVQVDEALKSSLGEIAKEQKITTDQMNALIQFNAQHQEQMQLAQIRTINEQVKSMPAEDRRLAVQGVERYLPEDLKERIFADNAVLTPDLVRILAILGKVGGEGKFVEGQAAKKENSLAELFPSMKPKQ